MTFGERVFPQESNDVPRSTRERQPTPKPASQRTLHKLLLFGLSLLLDCDVTAVGSVIGSTIMLLFELGRGAIFFLSFLFGKSLSLPAMTFPGCTTLNNTSAINIGKESRLY